MLRLASWDLYLTPLKKESLLLAVVLFAAAYSSAEATDVLTIGRFSFDFDARIARDLDELHGTNMLTKQTALTEKGAVVNGRGDRPNMHDILTGSLQVRATQQLRKLFRRRRVKIAIGAASGVVCLRCLIRREAIEQPRTAGALKLVLATVARGV